MGTEKVTGFIDDDSIEYLHCHRFNNSTALEDFLLVGPGQCTDLVVRPYKSIDYTGLYLIEDCCNICLETNSASLVGLSYDGWACERLFADDQCPFPKAEGA